jgi:SpoVK/Ycf46/Vps4 family AAA+-type ATPase
MNSIRTHRKTVSGKNTGPLTQEQNSSHETEYPFRKFYLRYAVNLLSSYTLSKEVLNYIISLVSIPLRFTLIEHLHNEGAFDDEDDHKKALANVDEQEQWTGYLYKAIITGKLKTGTRNMREYLGNILNEELQLLAGVEYPGFEKRMGKLMSLFYLTVEEIELLNFLYCIYSSGNRPFSKAADDIGFQEFFKFTSICTELPLPLVKKHLTLEGSLYQSRIIRYFDPIRSDYVSLDTSIEEYLSGFSDITLIDNYIQVDEDPVYELNSFSVDPMSEKIIKTILNSATPCNLLLYGVAGTGKTEFARSMVRALHSKLLILKHGQSEQRERYGRHITDSSERIKMLTIINKLLSIDDGILVIDEADFLLNTKSNATGAKASPEKGWLNSFLDSSNAKIIWISNEVGSMEDSTLRRFSYSLYFHEYSDKERHSIWNVILKESPHAHLFTRDLVKSLSSDYRVNAGGIASALKTLSLYITSRGGSKETDNTYEPFIRDILTRHEKLIHDEFDNDDENVILNAITDTYDLSVLNMDIPADTLMSSVEKFKKHLKDYADTYNGSINMLFWGLPGTGKTEFVKYVAKQTRLPLIIKRYSDLENPYIGECEKNIKNAFREARRKKAILFIDEADSFFTSRENAQRSWEVSRTNEFLTQMENHTGIFVCCTNLLPTLDWTDPLKLE